MKRRVRSRASRSVQSVSQVRLLAFLDVIYGTKRHQWENQAVPMQNGARVRASSSMDIYVIYEQAAPARAGAFCKSKDENATRAYFAACPPALPVSARLWAMTLAMARPSWPI